MVAIPSHPDVQIVSNETAWKGRFSVELIKFRQRRFDGAMSGVRSWELLCRGRAAAVLPYDPVTDQVALIEQFRLPALVAGLEPVMVEVPAGLCEGAEDPAATAVREAREEMGLPVDLLERMGDFLLTPGASDERCTMFAGRIRAPDAGPDGIIGQGGLDAEQEDIRVRLHPAANAIEAAAAGRYANSVTAIALLWLAVKRDWLRTRWAGR